MSSASRLASKEDFAHLINRTKRSKSISKGDRLTVDQAAEMLVLMTTNQRMLELQTMLENLDRSSMSMSYEDISNPRRFVHKIVDSRLRQLKEHLRS